MAPPAPDRTPASDLISALRERAPRAAMALAAGQMAWPAARALRARVRKRTTYTVKVPGTDDVYDELHEWVLGLLPYADQRALVAWTSRQHAVMETDGRTPAPSLRLRYDGAREQDITVSGHRIRVGVCDGMSTGEGGRWKPPEIVFTALSLTARDALLAELGAVLRRSHERQRQPSFRMMDKWGDWERVDDLPARSLDSVILAPGQLDRLTGDVTRWLAAEDQYARRCIPWHRGWLFEGPPGTGKTSAARAIAGYFGLDVWYLPLADVSKDGNLLRLVNRISKRSMLLLEDVDVFHAATRRDDDNDGATLSGLLNALDGIATPHGLLTVMTSNTPGALDEAVVRAGRADLAEHFGLADTEHAERLLAWYYACPVALPGFMGPVAPADVLEVCKRHEGPADATGELQARFMPAHQAAREAV